MREIMTQPPAKKKAKLMIERAREERIRKHLPKSSSSSNSNSNSHSHSHSHSHVSSSSLLKSYFKTPISELSAVQRGELLAELGEAILEDPKCAFTIERSHQTHQTHQTHNSSNSNSNSNSNSSAVSQNQCKMKCLLELATPTKNGQDYITSKLTLVSLLAIFQDILPSYRIRLPTEAERSVRVSSDTKKLWDYERNLIHYYKQYIYLLEKLYHHPSPSSPSPSSPHTNQNQRNNYSNHQNHSHELSITSILCLCQLLTSAPHFNFRSNILSIVAKEINQTKPSKMDIGDACYNAISTIMKQDAQGEIALEATRCLCKLVKDKIQTKQKNHTHTHNNTHHNTIILHPRVLHTFLSLPLRVHDDEAQAAKLAQTMQQSSKKKRKNNDNNDTVQQELQLEKDMREGDATVDKLQLARCQNDTLHAICLCYFRILQSVKTGLHSNLNHSKATIITDLLPPTLQGLAKFNHLIHMDTVHDLLQVFKALLTKVHYLPLQSSLHCILTAFRTLHGPGKHMMQVDLKEYITPLYSQIARLANNSHNNSTNTGTNTNNPNNDHPVTLALQCLQYAFLQRREYSTLRIAAFFHQLCTTSQHASPSISTPLLSFARLLMQRYPNAISQLLDNEQDIVVNINGGDAISNSHVNNNNILHDNDTDNHDFQCNMIDPEHTNPYSSSAWSLSNCRFHVHPSISRMADDAAHNRLLRLPIDDPNALARHLQRNEHELHIPYHFHMKKHPLDDGSRAKDKGIGTLTGSRSRNRRSRPQIRFITPRKTAHHHLKPI